MTVLTYSSDSRNQLIIDSVGRHFGRGGGHLDLLPGSASSGLDDQRFDDEKGEMADGGLVVHAPLWQQRCVR